MSAERLLASITVDLKNDAGCVTLCVRGEDWAAMSTDDREFVLWLVDYFRDRVRATGTRDEIAGLVGD